MKRSHKTTLTFFGIATLLTGVALAVPRKDGAALAPSQQAPRHVDLVIALDTSSSMDGLIDGARQKLWDVVNVLGQAKPTPTLRVGLISYGNDSYDASKGWVRKESDLTTDLDGIYAKLFALHTGGGNEYVARAIHDATHDMQWDQSPSSLKMVFVAGNEPANQDPKIPVESAVSDARERGIFVNTIYCGSTSAGEAMLWRQVAERGSGQYAAIDQNQVVTIVAPQDAELARLSAELNHTYVAYGAAGGAREAQQKEQDKNAASASPAVAATRAMAKGSKMYRNDDWDLVDARAQGKDVAHMKPEELPPALRAMTPEQRQALIDAKVKERAEVQKRISALSADRARFVAGEQAKHAKAGPALDDALGGAIRQEAKSAGFAF